MPMKLPVVGKDSYGYLSDVIINRDVWMHRIDIARAAERGCEPTADYDLPPFPLLFRSCKGDKV